MSDELRDKIARLPVWAREHIKCLEKRAEPNNDEIRLLRQRTENAEKRLKILDGRVQEMTELFRCAARGGHETAAAYVERVCREYGPEEVIDLTEATDGTPG